MHQSANDIVSISTNRETILIGSPGAFGVIHRRIVAQGRGEAGTALAHIFTLPGMAETLRPYLRRWGIEAAALKRMNNAALRNWLVRQAERGALAVAIVPDPLIAFAAHVTRQENSMQRAVAMRDSPIAESETLPPDIETRFLIAFEPVPDLLGQEAQKRVNELIALDGIETLATGILIWVGSQFIPGLHLVVIASDMYAMSGEVMRALETVGDCILALQKVSKRSEVVPITKILAGAIAVLAINGVLSRLLIAKQMTHGQSTSSSGKFNKPR